MPGLSLPRLTIPYWPPQLFAPDGPDNSTYDPSSQEESAGKESGQVRILIVDDAPDVLEMFDTMLRLSGYDTTVAPSAVEALELVRRAQFDIVVSDIGMPQMNGYELAQRIRELPGYKDVPMIAITGFAMFKDREQALQSGFNVHLSKPVNPITLLELIEKLRE